MGKFGEWFYRHAAKLIAGAILAAFIVFLTGLAWPKYQAAAFKGAELLVWGAGLLSVLLIRKQLHDHEVLRESTNDQLIEDHRWRTFAFYHDHFKELPAAACSEKVYELMDEEHAIDCFHDRGRPLAPGVVDKIKTERRFWEPVRDYLDGFEVFCGAINAKLLDEDYAFSLQGTRVVRNHAVFEAVMAHYKLGAPTAYAEFTKVALRWKIRMGVGEAAAVEGLGVGSNGMSTISGPRKNQ